MNIVRLFTLTVILVFAQSLAAAEDSPATTIRLGAAYTTASLLIQIGDGPQIEIMPDGKITHDGRVLGTDKEIYDAFIYIARQWGKLKLSDCKEALESHGFIVSKDQK